MALTNFILTVAGVSAVVLLLRSDVKQSATIFRRNVKHIRKWLEEESANAPKIFSQNHQGTGIKSFTKGGPQGGQALVSIWASWVVHNRWLFVPFL
ncbi:unnamed protein product [Prunus armeniaca]|uniref:Uncharacterized protein n=1 Tax=Prunus armeniaca TaxID=36596 RepID=A0A6J5UUE2_PRUAR|nr:unnamed protein product [Prunus armeniaca]